MVWNTDIFVKELELPGFKLIVESCNIPTQTDGVVSTFQKRQKFIDGLASWVGMKNLQVQEIAWEVADMQFGVTVRTQNEHPELKKEVVTFSNEQIAYMLTHGTFAEFAYDKYFWVPGDKMPMAEDKMALGDTLSTIKDTPKAAPFPKDLMNAIEGIRPPSVEERAVRDFNVPTPREQILRSAKTYLRHVTRYFSGEVENLRYKWIDLKEYPKTDTQPLERVPCTLEEATHIVVGVEIPGHCYEFLIAISDMVAASRFHQINSADPAYPFWLPAPQEWATTEVKEEEGLRDLFVESIDAMDDKESLDAEFNTFQQNLSQLMFATLTRANDAKLPTRNDGFLPLRAVAGLLEDFQKWLDNYFSDLIRYNKGDWERDIRIIDSTTLSLTVTERKSFKRYVLVYSFDDFFKDHIAAGLDWHPEARTFWRLPS
ncbi:hypothetical protein ASESINO_200 [Erwinia phage vB_EamM_Asesino]|uniref:Uncharacterized protein n=1 Tax=Erwinia phage vB_EamM_Asesino TaxID=1883370 RepID=A0A1B2IAB1_9CAUD|nr:hypothetical protein ASESINO_200 [Erwinia phage vB_EamM_Asesino]ANZ48213.1 hypothetical protein ASESINO_200 [Erwinia phage vB_EamM_Asesino]